MIRLDVSNAGTNHLAETNLCAVHGSSGGPVYKTHNGYGLVVSQGTNACDIYYQGLLGADDGSNVGIP